MTLPDRARCDELASSVLKVPLEELAAMRVTVERIDSYVYAGRYSDDCSLVVGPDYSMLVCDEETDVELMVAAYELGLRTDTEAAQALHSNEG